jgi:uncharacterized protein YbjT (DUF2867 family)
MYHQDFFKRLMAFFLQIFKCSLMLHYQSIQWEDTMIVVTGATGKTGSVIADLLLEKGEKVRVIGRSSERLKQLRDKGAEIEVGDQGDPVFLTRSFSNADSAYLLIPPKFDALDIRVFYNTMGDSAVAAIKDSGIKKVVFLSSLGAELEHGTGPVAGLHDVEDKLKWLIGVDIAILRPGYFMENTLGTIPLIKNQRINGSSMVSNAPVAMIATLDIAVKAVKLLTEKAFLGVSIIDLYGDRLSYWEATRQIGAVIGMPDLPYVQFSDKDAVAAFRKMGVSENVALSYVELSHAISMGKVRPTQIDPDKPNTPTRFKQFAEQVFRPAYKMAI